MRMAVGGGFTSHAAAAGCVLVAACGFANYGLGGSQGPGPDASDDGEAAPDSMSASDAPPESDAPATDAAGDGATGATVTIVRTDDSSATGLAQQAHLIYVANAQRWWLFYWGGGGPAANIDTLWSSDFVKWTASNTLQLPFNHAAVASGGDFSVAYANIGGSDVVHLNVGLVPSPGQYWHYHARATIAGPTITFGAPQDVSAVGSMGIDPDGCAVAIDSRGVVWDASGWAPWMNITSSTGDEEVWASANIDTGTAWTPGFGLRMDVAYSMNPIHARALVPVAGHLLAMWDDGAAPPEAKNLDYALYDEVSSTWSSPIPVFADPAPQGYDDWGVAAVSATEVHTLRRHQDGIYEHGQLTNDLWSTPAAPANEPGLADTGVVLLSHGPRLLAVAIAADGPNTVRTAQYDGVSWTPWSTLEGSMGMRRWLSGYSDGAGHAAVIWTQNDMMGYLIVGHPVSF